LPGKRDVSFALGGGGGWGGFARQVESGHCTMLL
jgi:hypothetical protein